MSSRVGAQDQLASTINELDSAVGRGQNGRSSFWVRTSAIDTRWSLSGEMDGRR